MVYAYDDETKSTSWSNFPVTFVQRAGLNLAELTEEQQDAALEVLEALLDDEAYATVVAIMGGDEYLHEYRTSTEASLGLSSRSIMVTEYPAAANADPIPLPIVPLPTTATRCRVFDGVGACAFPTRRCAR